MGDEVTCLDARLVSRAALERRNDFDRAFIKYDRKAKPRIVSVDHGCQALQRAAIDIGRMRIKRTEHAVDCAADKLVILNFFDIVGFDLLICCKKLGKLRACTPVNLRHSGSGSRDQSHSCNQSGAAQQISNSHRYSLQYYRSVLSRSAAERQMMISIRPAMVRSNGQNYSESGRTTPVLQEFLIANSEG